MRLVCAIAVVVMIAGRLSGDVIEQKSEQRFCLKSFIIPAILVGYGVVGIESDNLKLYNAEIKEEVNEHIDEKFTIDDISQYTPFVSVYVLDAFGVKGEHNFKDRTLILGGAYLIMGTTVLSLKHFISVERPDKTTWNSFPSGHTATAFMGAEFVYQEFKDVSIWYGVTAYCIAAGTGLFRMYNDRHWLTDVSAGAGFGILSTRLAYMLYDKWRPSASYQVLPAIDNNQYGLRFHVSF